MTGCVSALLVAACAGVVAFLVFAYTATTGSPVLPFIYTL